MPVVQAGVDQQFKDQRDLFAITGYQRYCCGETTTGARSSNSDACGIDAQLGGFGRHPPQGCIAILGRSREGVLGGQAVIDGYDDTPSFLDEACTKGVVLLGVAGCEPTAVNPEQPGKGRCAHGGRIDTYRYIGRTGRARHTPVFYKNALIGLTFREG